MSRCVCRAGFDGPRCQQTRHSFTGDASWALYPGLSVCSPLSHTSLELMTQHDNDVVVLYHGPVTDPRLQPGHATDFLLLEMRNGFPMLRVDHGSGLLSATHTHTHPFNGPLSGSTRVSRFHKGKTNLDFTEARDSEWQWQWHQLGYMQACTLLQTDNHFSTPPLRFLQARCPFCLPTNSVSALKLTANKQQAQHQNV